MQIEKWIKNATAKLTLASIETARLDILVLMSDILGKDKAWILAHPEYYISSDHMGILDSLIARRLDHEPLSYIRGKAEFYGREFIVSKDTLQPRAETESVIEALRQIFNNEVNNKTILDIGTGSGCIAVTVNLEWPENTVLATDISSKALKIANKNAIKHRSKVNFKEGNLLEPFITGQKIDFILANLPYVPNSYEINRAARHEPGMAIFGGKTGLELFESLFRQIDKLEYKPSHIFTESLEFQHDELSKIAKSHGYKFNLTKDLVQVFSSLALPQA